MKKVGICGNYGNQSGKENGQTIKTKMLTSELKKKYGDKEIKVFDVSNCHSKIMLGFRAIELAIVCKNIIILPAQRALLPELKLFLFLCNILNRRLHYYVVGGWLCDDLKDNRPLLQLLGKCFGIYVELDDMQNQLEKLGLKNVFKVFKFKDVEIDGNYLTPSNSPPYSLVYFSRVSKEKGVEDAIYGIEKVNKTLGKVFYSLDIYGKVDEPYIETFNSKKREFPDYINYHGCIDSKESTGVLKKYYAMIFPTFYAGEGYPNAVVDAFVAGIPIIATDWKYNKTILNHMQDSLVYTRVNEDSLFYLLMSISNNPQTLIDLRPAAIERGKKYSPQNAIEQLLINLR